MKTLTQDRDNIQLLYEQVSDAFFDYEGSKWERESDLACGGTILLVLKSQLVWIVLYLINREGGASCKLIGAKIAMAKMTLDT